MSDQISLRELDTFGNVAAEDDEVLLQYFLSTDAVKQIESGSAFLVLGRKGTGKTAIVRYLTEESKETHSQSLNLRGYPWSVHATRIDRGASPIEAYVASWRYLIAVELASLVASAPGAISEAVKPIIQFLSDNYGGSRPRLSDILRPAKLKISRYSISPSIMGNQLGSVDLDRAGDNHNFGLELDAISGSLLESVRDVCRETRIRPLSLHLDELDQGVTSLDDNRRNMLIGLILAARDVRSECAKDGAKIFPVIYLRTDLWEELNFSDKNKIAQTSTLPLEWNSDSLKRMVETRLRAKLSENADWESITDRDLMRGSQEKWAHILARTFLRPRDVIHFLNATLNTAKKRSENPLVITNKDIVNSRENYSSYLKAELDDEIVPHWRTWIEALQACSVIGTVVFDRSSFEVEYDKRRSKNNSIPADEALALLYRFSVIGCERRSGYGGVKWTYQYANPEAGWDAAAVRFKVHLGLKENARLRESRVGQATSLIVEDDGGY